MQKDPYSLDRLQDIVEPAPVSWWPPAPIWYCILALVVVWFGYWIIRSICSWINDAYRRRALAELMTMQHSGEGSKGANRLVEISELLKRVALISFPRERVASLSGRAWLEFLNSSCDGVDFSSGAARHIGTASYESESLLATEQDWGEIIAIARRWIRGHRSEASE